MQTNRRITVSKSAAKASTKRAARTLTGKPATKHPAPASIKPANSVKPATGNANAAPANSPAKPSAVLRNFSEGLIAARYPFGAENINDIAFAAYYARATKSPGQAVDLSEHRRNRTTNDLNPACGRNNVADLGRLIRLAKHGFGAYTTSPLTFTLSATGLAHGRKFLALDIKARAKLFA